MAPVPTPVIEPTAPEAAPATANVAPPEPAGEGGRAWLALLAAGLALLAGVGGFLLWRRSRANRYDDRDRIISFDEAPEGTAPPAAAPADPVAVAEREAAPLDGATADEAAPMADAAISEPAAEGVAAATIPAQAQDGRPWIEFALRPVKAGVNVMDAVVEFELTVGNAGAVAADDVRIAAWLLSASPNQEAEIARFLEDTPAEAVMAPIEIPPGGGQQVNAAIALPRAGVNVVTVRDRRFFVPLVVADARYRLPDGGEGRTSATFVVGTARDGQEKLGPIWLDRGIRMHANVEARLHGDPARA
ncbi:hypothetical protein D1610_10335 [Sphingomonas gilva]|uniref:Uncharacterized protein n=2 Tax=Sphingomonas gilva TaxID=2305907 RepID=A0A396RNM1_9SPHN|nr:hypothetical protein D1610_10335 [Sphingomonas gilva]